MKSTRIWKGNWRNTHWNQIQILILILIQSLVLIQFCRLPTPLLLLLLPSLSPTLEAVVVNITDMLPSLSATVVSSGYLSSHLHHCYPLNWIWTKSWRRKLRPCPPPPHRFTPPPPPYDLRNYHVSPQGRDVIHCYRHRWTRTMKMRPRSTRR